MNGYVKWFNAEKGFGFIVGEDNNEYFAHFSQIQADGYRQLEENEEVTFETEKSDRGLQAINIVRR